MSLKKSGIKTQKTSPPNKPQAGAVTGVQRVWLSGSQTDRRGQTATGVQLVWLAGQQTYRRAKRDRGFSWPGWPGC